MTPLSTFIRYELKRVLSNICRMHAAENREPPDELAVKLLIIDQLKSLKLAEVQEEDVRKIG